LEPCSIEEYIEEAEYTRDWINIDEFDNKEGYADLNDDEEEVEVYQDTPQVSSDDDLPADELIRNWALKTYQSHQALNGLLEILRKLGHQLPKDARTLLRTKQCGKEIVSISGGEFWFPGIRATLKNNFRDIQPRVSSFSLNISVDGLPLHKSTRKQFWSILISIQERPETPVLMIGNFLGESKPSSVEQYLRPLVDELNDLIQNGIQISNKFIEVRVRAFIADSPARAFIKGVAYFNQKIGCQRCTVEGRYHNIARVMCFPGIDAPPRTDEDFRNGKYGDHHRERTPLRDLLWFNLITNVVVADCLHLIDYGVTRTMLKGWMLGKLGTHGKWSSNTLSKINSLLKQVELPLEFHRKFRNIEDIGLWKASEFKMFLRYASFVVLKEALTETEYQHFMLYFCAITLLSSEVYREFWYEANELLRQFVINYGLIYASCNMLKNHFEMVIRYWFKLQIGTNTKISIIKK
uniref:Transposase domain-containing protein n=1 Tax=Anopheles epiroticus TaxID=199890 RepID=A0A182PX78_9DIPT